MCMGSYSQEVSPTDAAQHCRDGYRFPCFGFVSVWLAEELPERAAHSEFALPNLCAAGMSVWLNFVFGGVEAIGNLEGAGWGCW